MGSVDAQIRLDLLSRVIAHLAESSDCEHALEEMARAVVAARDVADFCAVDLVDEPGLPPRLIAVAHPEASLVDRARRMRRQALLDEGSPIGLMKVLRTGERDLVARGDQAPPGLESELGLRSWVVVPVFVGHTVAGALTLASVESRRTMGESEAELAAALASAVASAVDRARLRSERNEILAVLSHDLRTPLGVILLVVDLLGQDGVPDAVSRQLGRLERAAKAMDRLMTDIVEAGRLESGAMQAEAEMVDAGRMVEEAYEAAWAGATDAGVDLERHVASGISMRGDRGRLMRALHYLIEGAVKRTPSGGRVTVSVERRGNEVLLSIGDGGADLGALAEQRAAQGASARGGIRVRPASALGWALARGVVRSHGGRLWIERRSGGVAVGNLVRITLPLSGG
ncbi:MAG TPA: HAMP domain-containing sensor histidine kinase [Kofleriaceae bacterium]|nr:HAMP domain-containing sensor histidine kinase [Kofleriaceae bacterium]